MKQIALLAAAGSLAAMSAPAYAADIAPMPGATGTVSTVELASVFDTLEENAHHADHGPRYDRRYGRRYDDRYYDDDDYYEDRYDDRRKRYHEPRRIRRGDRIWRGRDGRYYCKRGDGTTGLIIGAAGGALIGRAIDTRGDRTVGTLLGGAIGALLGREIDRGELRCR
ncbi:glycine zipper 2TM domain-containing protein [Erythrobacter sp. THAF29]|uniref:glycine zipper 2TM domain-containing protein n=1 Tax=Erythrobacter sp. THAF29 TaxID=2587851 RepID=UPI0012692E8A|nr:glycine zipper 2TM domain-containing protein [Erythrobacter sp. THAF29]QFT78212.1 Glycine zipper 2TM domain protein [Erythrobacter sp. THAF29]